MPNDTPRSDAAEVCQWMEKMPDKGPMEYHPWRSASPKAWWLALILDDSTDAIWVPRDIGLEECHVAEEKLTQAQKMAYNRRLAESQNLDCLFTWHASSRTRLRCLAAVIRSTR